ncbi:hypothetical protein ADICEAN_01607 [Cesiribacter andamanensis AMV16]|uniref:Uncharacterized protein n=1 Tax=Cesiribacter andamanensis AMV16 TaxID=1279009 RepID=M7NXW6_9BACT|nr:hypothetical protein ADICEAN_01607 [Cesiribacter andamanensis AMV16]
MLLLGSFMAQAQVYVYHVKGTAYLLEKGQQHALQPESVLARGQKLLLEANSRVVLINQQGSNVLLQKAGTYTYAAVEKRFAEPQPDAGSAFLAYAWKKINKSKLKPEQQRNAPIAGVARGEALMLQSPADSLVLVGPELQLEWLGGEGPYYLTLADAQGKPLLRLQTPATSIRIHLAQSGVVPNRQYSWYVSEQAPGSGTEQGHSFLWVEQAVLRQAVENMQQVFALAPAEELSDASRRRLNQYLFEQLLYRLETP